MSTTYIFIKYAKGIDSGFGDYCSPDWTVAPTLKDENGKAVWFSDPEVAAKFTELCNEKSKNDYYDVVGREPYSGDFPVEYAMFSLEVPDHTAWDDADAAFSKLKKKIEEYVFTDPYIEW